MVSGIFWHPRQLIKRVSFWDLFLAGHSINAIWRAHTNNVIVRWATLVAAKAAAVKRLTEVIALIWR